MGQTKQAPKSFARIDTVRGEAVVEPHPLAKPPFMPGDLVRLKSGSTGVTVNRSFVGADGIAYVEIAVSASGYGPQRIETNGALFRTEVIPVHLLCKVDEIPD